MLHGPGRGVLRPTIGGNEPVRGWTILSDSVPDASITIAAAPGYQINHVQLSERGSLDCHISAGHGLERLAGCLLPVGRSGGQLTPREAIILSGPRSRSRLRQKEHSWGPCRQSEISQAGAHYL